MKSHLLFTGHILGSVQRLSFFSKGRLHLVILQTEIRQDGDKVNAGGRESARERAKETI